MASLRLAPTTKDFPAKLGKGGHEVGLRANPSLVTSDRLVARCDDKLSPRPLPMRERIPPLRGPANVDIERLALAMDDVHDFPVEYSSRTSKARIEPLPSQVSQPTDNRKPIFGCLKT